GHRFWVRVRGVCGTCTQNACDASAPLVVEDSAVVAVPCTDSCKPHASHSPVTVAPPGHPPTDTNSVYVSAGEVVKLYAPSAGNGVWRTWYSSADYDNPGTPLATGAEYDVTAAQGSSPYWVRTTDSAGVVLDDSQIVVISTASVVNIIADPPGGTVPFNTIL